VHLETNSINDRQLRIVTADASGAHRRPAAATGSIVGGQLPGNRDHRQDGATSARGAENLPGLPGCRSAAFPNFISLTARYSYSGCPLHHHRDADAHINRCSPRWRRRGDVLEVTAGPTRIPRPDAEQVRDSSSCSANAPPRTATTSNPHGEAVGEDRSRESLARSHDAPCRCALSAASRRRRLADAVIPYATVVGAEAPPLEGLRWRTAEQGRFPRPAVE